MDAEDFQQNNEHGGYPIVVIRSRSMTVRTMFVLVPIGLVFVTAYWGIKWLGWG